MTYDDWEADVPDELKGDPVWKVEAYRLGLFLSDLSWEDVTKLFKDRRTVRFADQFSRSAPSVSSDICEGYSRATPMDRARFYGFALGSSRESRDWYYKSRHVLSERVVAHRMQIATQTVKLLVKMIENEQRKTSRVHRKS
jgi:four helix bundle protein